ncbi:MAG: hypothetical protein JWM27_1529, partial [Gemmatimonadetes bacterium]|nr:hypothetical protein [Gemmatimonadota bacterium]
MTYRKMAAILLSGIAAAACASPRPSAAGPAPMA